MLYFRPKMSRVKISGMLHLLLFIHYNKTIHLIHESEMSITTPLVLRGEGVFQGKVFTLCMIS